MSQVSRFLLAVSLAAATAAATAPSARAHKGNVVDSAIEIAGPGIRLNFTVPIDDFVANMPKEAITPEAYSDAVLDAWTFTADDKDCLPVDISAQVIGDGHVFNYIVHYECDAAMNTVKVDYGLFEPSAAPHENMLRILIADKVSGLSVKRYSSSFSIPVRSLLNRWQRRLPDTFAAAD